MKEERDGDGRGAMRMNVATRCGSRAGSRPSILQPFPRWIIQIRWKSSHPHPFSQIALYCRKKKNVLNDSWSSSHYYHTNFQRNCEQRTERTQRRSWSVAAPTFIRGRKTEKRNRAAVLVDRWTEAHTSYVPGHPTRIAALTFSVALATKDTAATTVGVFERSEVGTVLHMQCPSNSCSAWFQQCIPAGGRFTPSCNVCWLQIVGG